MHLEPHFSLLASLLGDSPYDTTDCSTDCSSDSCCPTIICNNRDEYYDRETVRGAFCSGVNGGSYSPLDKESGGSWLSFQGLETRTLRYAIVLNLHVWRYNSISTGTKSRGLLIKDYIDDRSITAQEYASKIHAMSAAYRPFNLIVSDAATGTWYVSSISGPCRLHPKKVYGISNGRMDEWMKVAVGKKLMQQIIKRHFSLYESDTVPMGGLVEELMRDLLMYSDSLLDPTFGNRSRSAMQLSSIFVVPTTIHRDTNANQDNKSFWRTLAAAFLGYSSFVVALLGMTYKYSKPVEFSNGWTIGPYVWCFMAGTALASTGVKVFCTFKAHLIATLILSKFDFVRSDVEVSRDVFGTRTATVLMHCPGNNDGEEEFHLVEKDLVHPVEWSRMFAISNFSDWSCWHQEKYFSRKND